MNKKLWALALIIPLALTIWISKPEASAQDAPARGLVALSNHQVSGNANILSTSLTPSTRYPVVAYRVTIGLTTTDSVVNVQIGNGTVTGEFDLNSGTALTAGQLYTFVFSAYRTDFQARSMTYNFQCETATYVGYLSIEAIEQGGN